jgi:hypothetical protein
MTGVNFTLEGGFWPGIIVPSDTGAPTLFIQQSSANVIISWSPTTPGFLLEETSDLASPPGLPPPPEIQPRHFHPRPRQNSIVSANHEPLTLTWFSS